MKGRNLLTIVILLIVLLSACTGGERANVKDVVKDYETTLNAGDIDAVMALFAERAAFTTFEKDILIGRENIRKYLQLKIDEGVQIETSIRTVTTGNLVATFGTVISLGGGSAHMEANMSIKDGKIQSITHW